MFTSQASCHEHVYYRTTQFFLLLCHICRGKVSYARFFQQKLLVLVMRAAIVYHLVPLKTQSLGCLPQKEELERWFRGKSTSCSFKGCRLDSQQLLTVYNSSSLDPLPSSVLCGHCMHSVHIHAGKTLQKEKKKENTVWTQFRASSTVTCFPVYLVSPDHSSNIAFRTNGQMACGSLNTVRYPLISSMKFRTFQMLQRFLDTMSDLTA